MALASIPRRQPFRLLLLGVEAGALAFASLLAAGLIAMLGTRAVFYPLWAIVTVLGVLYPRKVTLLLVAAIVVVDPQARVTPGDFMDLPATYLYTLPAELESVLPINLMPFQLAMLAIAGSLLFRSAPRTTGLSKPPWLVWAVPILMLAGFGFGLSRGGVFTLMYWEAHGLIFGMIAFYITLRIRDIDPQLVQRWVIIASTLLAVSILLRYLLYFSGDGTEVAFQFQFAHANSLFMAIGFAVASVALIRSSSAAGTTALAAHQLLVLTAAAATGRRTAILLLLVAGIIMLWLLLPKRPAPVVFAIIVTAVIGGGYLAAFWGSAYNFEASAIAQPARAIRSQVDPNPRDAASNNYRKTEHFNLVQTIRSSPLLGIGFGREYIRYNPLPIITYWDLQFLTPENNILWLWLKMGIAGISVVVGVWLIALQRCFRAFRNAPGPRISPIPLVLATTLVLYFVNAHLEQVLTHPRPMVPLGIVLALAFTLPLRDLEGERAHAPLQPDAEG